MVQLESNSSDQYLVNNESHKSSKVSHKQRKKNPPHPHPQPQSQSQSQSHPSSGRRGSIVAVESSSDSAETEINLNRQGTGSFSSSSVRLSTSQGEISSIFWLSFCMGLSYLTFTIISHYNSSFNHPVTNSDPLASRTTITSLSNYNLDHKTHKQSNHLVGVVGGGGSNQHLFESISSLPSTSPSSNPFSSNNLLSSSKSNPNPQVAKKHPKNFFPLSSSYPVSISKLFDLSLSFNPMKSSLLSNLFGKSGGSSAAAPSISVSGKSFFSNSIKNDAAINLNERSLENWIANFGLGFLQSFKKLAQMETILLIAICLFTLALIAYWTNPSESSFRTYLTDSSLRQSLRQLESENDEHSLESKSRTKFSSSKPANGISMSRSPSDDELEQQLSSNSSLNHVNEFSHPSITFAHKVSLSLRTPPYVKRDGKIYTVMTVKHAKKARGGSSLNPSQNRFSKKNFNEHESLSSSGNDSNPMSKGNKRQCLECGFREDAPSGLLNSNSDSSRNDPIKNHEHVSWYLGAFGTWWLVAQGWEIDSPPPTASSANNPASDETSTELSFDQVKTISHKSSSSNMAGSLGKKTKKNWSRENLKDVQWKREMEMKRNRTNDYGVLEMKVLKDEDESSDLLQNQNFAKVGDRSDAEFRDPNHVDHSIHSSDPRSSRRKRAKARTGTAKSSPKDETPSSAPNASVADSQDLSKPSQLSPATTSTPRHIHEILPTQSSSNELHSSAQDMDDLSASLAAAQATNADLEAQLAAVQQASSSTKSQLNAQLEALRTRKKEEDAARSEIKTKMKSLDEGKRQAEATKREAERRLKAITGVRNAIQSKIDSHRKENQALKEKIVQREKKLIEQEKESEKEELEFKNSEMERDENKLREESELEQLQTKVALLNGKLQEHQANLEAAKALAIERQVQMQAEAVAMARAQAEARAAQAQARALAKAQAQAQAHAYAQVQAQQAAQQAANLNVNNLPPRNTSNIYPLLSGPGDFPSHPYDGAWVSAPGSQQNSLASAPINMPVGGSFLSPLDFSAGGQDLRQRELSTSSSSGAFSPPLNSPFYTDLLPSNLFASADEDDDDLRGIFPGRERSATLEEALGRFGLASSESGASEDKDDDQNEETGGFRISGDFTREEKDPANQDQIVEQQHSFSDALAGGVEAEDNDHDEPFADAPTSRLASPTQPISPREEASPAELHPLEKDKEVLKSPSTSVSSPKVEEVGEEQNTSTFRSRSMRRPGSKGSAGRTWWGKSRNESVARSDVTAEAEEKSEEVDDNQVNEGQDLENRRSRTFSVLPKLSLNPAAKAFKSSTKNSRSGSSDIPNSFPSGRPVPQNNRLGSGGWTGAVPSAPISDYEAVRRAFEASGFPPEDEDEQGRRSWSAFDSWQAHQSQGQSQIQGIPAVGNGGGKRQYFSQHPSPLIGAGSHLFNAGNNEWNINPRTSSDSLPFSFNKTQAAPISSVFGGNHVLDDGMDPHHQSGGLTHLQSSSGIAYQQQQGQANFNHNRPMNSSSSWLSDDELFNPLARSISAGNVSSTSLGSNSVSNNSNSSSQNNNQAARSRFVPWNRKSQGASNPSADSDETSIPNDKGKGINKENSSVNVHLSVEAAIAIGEGSSSSEAAPPRTPDLQIGTGSASQEATPTGPQINTPSRRRGFSRWGKRDSTTSSEWN